MLATTFLSLVAYVLCTRFEVAVMIDTANWPVRPVVDKALTIRLKTDSNQYLGGPLTITKDANRFEARDAISFALRDSDWTVTRVAATLVVVVPPRTPSSGGWRRRNRTGRRRSGLS